jgi:hypothetical protein
VAAELHLLAEIVVPGSTDVTLPTRVGRLYDDPLTLASSGGNDAAHLVAQDERNLHPVVADAAVFEPVQVRTAQTHGRNANEYLTGARDRLRFRVQSDIAGTVEPEEVHAFHHSAGPVVRSGAWCQLGAAHRSSNRSAGSLRGGVGH